MKSTIFNVYHAIQNNDLKPNLANSAEDLSALDWDDPNVDRLLIDNIKQMQKNNFTYCARDGHDLYIVYHSPVKITNDPINSCEAKIQALRYLRGLLLISNYLPENNRKLINKIKHVYSLYVKLSSYIKNSVDLTHWLAEQCAEALVEPMHISNAMARTQVSMARDLAILLEDHPAVITISDYHRRLCIEEAHLLKLNPGMYQREFNINATFLKNAKELAGLNPLKQSWLDNFFADEKIITKLQKNGVPAPSSARWLPLPCNSQKMQVTVCRKQQNAIDIMTSSSFIRMGVICAYDINNAAEKKRLAVEQLKTVIENQLEESINRFKQMYAPLLNLTATQFYINYQTLLTPHHGEIYLDWLYKDNNDKFVSMAGKALNSVANCFSDNHGLKKLVFLHTNTAINHRSAYITAKNSDSHNVQRKLKIKETATILSALANQHHLNKLNNIVNFLSDEPCLESNLQNDVESFAKQLDQGKLFPELPVELQQELALRMRSSFYLQQLLNHSAIYKGLSIYQRNIMMAALEFHSLGSQALVLAGCKSARDRTSIFATAIKTMQESPNAMRSWNTLNVGIEKSLLQGHCFRALSHHVPIVKIRAVHQYFLRNIPQRIQLEINKLKIFAETLPSLAQSVTMAVKKALEIINAKFKVNLSSKRILTSLGNRANKCLPQYPIETTNKSDKLDSSICECFDVEKENKIERRMSL